MTTLTNKQERLRDGLRLVTKPRITVQMFRTFFSDQLLEGLQSKDYVHVEGNEVVISLQGIRALLDFEGMKM